MPKLFHLSCSPRPDSESSAGAKVFVDRFRQARPDWDIDGMNLWRDHLPEFEGYVLEAMLNADGRDFVIVTGAWTNMSIEHTARTGADKGFYMVVPEDCCSTMNAEWHIAAVNYAIQNVAMVTRADDLIAALS